jgi:UDP-GlcNAc:undecaprenyl-phosphate GlcNAc-1-phosphate transferase
MLIDQLKHGLFLFPFFMVFLILVAKKFSIVDKPNKRKIHKVKIVNISGIAIFSSLIFIVANTELSNDLEQIIIIGFFVVLIGFIDDRKEIRPSTKLTLIFFPSIYLILNGFELSDLGKYEYINVIQLGKLSIIFTLLAVALLINAINYIDGTDGLLIGYTITALSYFYLLSDNQNQYTQLFLIFIYILIISLFFNFLPVRSGLKSFLGDSGSLFIGFFLSFTIIFLYKYQNIHPAFLIWVCWLPIYDFLYVTFKRLSIKRNFSQPDKTHLHHYILKYFFKNHFKTFLFINILNMIIIYIGYLVCLFIGKIYSLYLFIFLFLIFILIRLKLEKN